MYARVTAAERDLDPVLACTDAQGKVSTACPLAPWPALDAMICGVTVLHGCQCCQAKCCTGALHVLHVHMKRVQSNVKEDLPA